MTPTQTALIGLIGIGIGALLVGVINAAVGRYAAFKESQALAAALRVDLEDLLRAGEAYDLVAQLAQTIAYLKAGAGTPAPDDFYDMIGERQECLVFQANCAKIGLLASVAGPVVAAYSSFLTAREGLFGAGERHRRQPMTRPQLILIHETTRTFLLNATERAKVAVEKLKDHERRWWLTSILTGRGAAR